MEKLDSKLEEFKEGQEKVASAAVRKARQEPCFTFRKKSHEEQSKLNEKVDEAMREPEAELMFGAPATHHLLT